MTKHDFPTFAVWWMQRQNLRTPAMHYEMMTWLEKYGTRKGAKLCLQAFRSAGKSTIIGLYCAWRIYQNPDIRIIVLAADQPLAKKMVRNVKRIIERHPLTKFLKPDSADQWAGERFTVNRATELRDPSMMARGISSNITGSRADLIICDDVEVPNTSDSREKRMDLRERLAEIAFVLVPNGEQIYVGTPHTYHSIYSEKPHKDMNEARAFLQGFKTLKIPILTRKNKPAWPERYTADMIESIRQQSGPNKFQSQMMLIPVNIANGRLNPDLLKTYTHKLDYAKELGTLFLGAHKMVGSSVFWDPAFASATGDNSVIAFAFYDAVGNIYIHDVHYITVPHTPDNDNEARLQSVQVAALCKHYYTPVMTVETNGLGKWLPNILRGVLAKSNTPCAILECHQTKNKELRILEAFDAPLAAGKLYVHERVMNTPFATEMREWRPDHRGGHDDGLDAVAGALLLTPMTIERTPVTRGHTWMKRPGAGQFQANTNYTI